MRLRYLDIARDHLVLFMFDVERKVVVALAYVIFYSCRKLSSNLFDWIFFRFPSFFVNDFSYTLFLDGCSWIL